MLPSYPRRRPGNFGRTPAPSSRSGSSAGDQLRSDDINYTAASSRIFAPRTAIYHIPHLTRLRFIERPNPHTTQSHLISFVLPICCNKKRAYTGAQHYKKFGLNGQDLFLFSFFCFGTGRGVRSHWVRRKIPCTLIHYWDLVLLSI